MSLDSWRNVQRPSVSASVEVTPARVIAGSAGWYVVDSHLDGGVTLYGPMLSVELAHEVAEECDHRSHVRMMWVRNEFAGRPLSFDDLVRGSELAMRAPFGTAESFWSGG